MSDFSWSWCCASAEEWRRLFTSHIYLWSFIYELLVVCTSDW